MIIRVRLASALACLIVVACATAGEPVELIASDAEAVAGLAFGEEGRGILLVGAPGRSPSDWGSLGRHLGDAGYAVLALEIRTAAERISARDVTAGLDWFARPPALVTEREGLGPVLRAVGSRPIAALVALSPAVTPGVVERMRRVGAPVFLASSIGDDEAVAAQRLLGANTPPPSRAELYGGDDSGIGLLSGEEGGQVAADILEFLAMVPEEP